MRAFYEIFSYVALVSILLMFIVPSTALLIASIKENRELDEEIRRKKAQAKKSEVQKEKLAHL